MFNLNINSISSQISTLNLDKNHCPSFSIQEHFGLHRPEKLLEAIDQCYAKASQKDKGGYLTVGTSLYTFGDKSSDDFVNHMMSRSFSKPWKLLDVGTGDGQFLTHVKKNFGNQVESIGISASDLRSNSRDIPDDQYLLLNAEKILSHLNFKDYPASFDGIVSAYTFMHLLDPLCALAQLYELLKPQGVLYVDSFMCYGLNGYMHQMINFLNQQGYHITAGFTKNGNKKGEVSFMIIEKTHDHLNFPVKYSCELIHPYKQRLKYEVDFSFLNPIPSEELEVEEPKDVVDAQGKSIRSRMVKLDLDRDNINPNFIVLKP